jgi:DNA mismatch repair protein MutL
LIRDDKLIYDLLKAKDRLTRITAIFANFKAEDLLSISYDELGYVVSGYVAAPKFSTINTAKQFFFLNNRYIKNALLNKAVKEGFASAIMQHENPSYIIFLQFNNSSFDVNVHPRKLEVRFEDPGKIFKIVKNAVKFTIEKTTQNQLKERFAASNRPISTTTTRGKSVLRTENAAQEFISFQSPKTENVSSSLNFTKGLLEQVNIEVKEKENFSNNIVIGSHEFLQIFNTYIVTSNQDKMIVIDQHAAHERINFEKIKNNIIKGKELDTQDLLIPEKLELTKSDRLILKTKLQILNIIGFRFQDVKQDTALLVSIPAILPIANIHTTLKAILEEIDEDALRESDAWARINDKIISTMACHSSIRAGQRLTSEAVTQLLNDLAKCKLPYSCPHGRPIVWEISRMEIEKKFKRII